MRGITPFTPYDGEPDAEAQGCKCCGGVRSKKIKAPASARRVLSEEVTEKPMLCCLSWPSINITEEVKQLGENVKKEKKARAKLIRKADKKQLTDVAKDLRGKGENSEKDISTLTIEQFELQKG